MSYRFSEKLYPEVALFPTEAAGEEACKAWGKRFVKSWQTWATMIVIAIVLVVVLLLVSLAMRRWLPNLPVPIMSAIVGSICGGGVVTLIGLLFRNACRRFLRERLIEQGVPVCLPCGYDLREIKSARCPECGAERFDVGTG